MAVFQYTNLGTRDVSTDLLRRGQERSQAHAAIRLHVALAAAVWSFHLLGGVPYVTLIAGGLLATIAYPALALMEMRRVPLLLSPLSFYFLWYTVGLGAAAIYTGLQVQANQPVQFSTQILVPEDIAYGYAVYLTGSLALHASLQRFRPRHGIAMLSHESHLIAWMAVIYLAGLVAAFIPNLLAPLGTLASPLQWAPLGALSSFALASPSQLGLSPLAFGLVLTIGTAGLLAGELNSGLKGSIMFSLFPVFWLFLVRPSLRRWLPALAGVAALMYTVALPVVTLSRSRANLYSRDTSQAVRIVDAFHAWRGGERAPSSYSDTNQVDEFFSRVFDPVPVGCIVSLVRDGGLMMGKTMEYLTYAFIPRIIWPAKPYVTRGTWFNYYLGGAEVADPTTSSTPLTSVGQTATGELYWNFGIPGVVVGMAIIGILLGGLWRMAGEAPNDSPMQMLLYVSVMLNMPNMSEAGSVILACISNLVVFGSIFYGIRILGYRK
jgi:hypothetical protein